MAEKSKQLRRPTLLIDFDGVLHQCPGGEYSPVLGPALDKARAALLLLGRDYRLAVFTTRTNREEIATWLRQRGFPEMRVTNIKEPAHLIIDDRAITFPGAWTDEFISAIRTFTPHWKRDPPDGEKPSTGPLLPSQTPLD